MTRKTLELSPPLQTSATHQRENILSTMHELARNKHSGSSAESGFKSGTFRPRSQDLTVDQHSLCYKPPLLKVLSMSSDSPCMWPTHPPGKRGKPKYLDEKLTDKQQSPLRVQR
ncbi:hypothetical protein AVEN_95985-1 [Araneus ventricosus]|uniref:Uncharacterized protein n=1 Tax=Araneus ventricosus TaxID=182803 RepID=A0A4Y2B5Z6_ARAVE|nr:hypothetical protein AVEN_95985-1 [Araneus ventricosus]